VGDVAQATVLVSILMICLGAILFVRHRLRGARATGPEEFGGSPAQTAPPVPGPPPVAAIMSAEVSPRAEPVPPAAVPAPAEITEPVPAEPRPPARRARTNSGASHFGAPVSRVHARRA
jgi:hypothetical protein